MTAEPQLVGPESGRDLFAEEWARLRARDGASLAVVEPEREITVAELVTIANIKMTSKGYKMTDHAQASLESIIAKGTTPELRSKYNGRLVDNLLQWASDEMNTRLPLDAAGDQLITLETSDFANAIKRFATARPPTKADPALAGGKQVETQLATWGLSQYTEVFVRAGYRQLWQFPVEATREGLDLELDDDRCRLIELLARIEMEMSPDPVEQGPDLLLKLKTKGLAKRLLVDAPALNQHLAERKVDGAVALGIQDGFLGHLDTPGAFFHNPA